jgi:hypothetical protein
MPTALSITRGDLTAENFVSTHLFRSIRGGRVFGRFDRLYLDMM